MGLGETVEHLPGDALVGSRTAVGEELPHPLRTVGGPQPWISMMSIPREIQVTLQTAGGPVTTRLNAALIYGGFPLLLSPCFRPDCSASTTTSRA
jgi:hypothetical protein